jgi:hypothetical protein
MRSRGERRISLWVLRIDKWAKAQIEEYGPASKEGLYFYGVTLGISAAKGSMAAPKNMKRKYKPRTVKGFEDAQWLIKKALDHGEPPAGTFLELLEAPHSQPVAGRWSRRDGSG